MRQSPTIILYDGRCTICTQAAAKISKLDNNRSIIEPADLHTHHEIIKQYDLNANEIRRVMHAITPDGQILTAMNALRHTMTRLNRGWMVNWTKLPLIKPLTDQLYLIFANNRNRFNRRHQCNDDSCSI